MDDFIYQSYIPSLGKITDLYELKYSTFKSLVKTLLNNNNKQISLFFDKILDNLLVEKNLELTFFDKLYLLLTIRTICITPVLELTIPDKINKKDNPLSIDLSNIITTLKDIILPHELLHTEKTYNKIHVEYGLPVSLLTEKTENSFLTTIKRIKFNNEEVDINDPNITELLPANIFKDCKEHFNKIEKFFESYYLLNFKLPNEKIELNISLADNTVLEFLKIIFKRDLLSLYEFEYYFVTKANLGSNLLHNSTPAEINVYMNLFKKEIEERNKSNKELNMPNKGPNYKHE